MLHRGARLRRTLELAGLTALGLTREMRERLWAGVNLRKLGLKVSPQLLFFDCAHLSVSAAFASTLLLPRATLTIRTPV